jgi:hypothetical protein
MTTSDPQHAQLGAVEVHGMTRSHFLLKGAIATGAAFGVSAVGPFVGSAGQGQVDRPLGPGQVAGDLLR